MLYVFLNLIFYITFLVTANAADFSYSKVSPHNGKKMSNSIGEYLHIKGEIEAGDAEKFKAFIKNDPWTYILSKSIAISSNGGSVSDAIQIGDIIKNTYKSVVVSKYIGQCLSSCFLIVTSAAERDIDSGKVGIHRPYYPKEKLDKKSLKEVQNLNEKLYSDSKEYLETLNVPRYLIELMLSRTSNEVYWLTNQDKINVGRRPLWYEEYLVTMCGFNKNLERKFDDPTIFDSSLDDEYFSMLQRVDECSLNKTEDEKVAYLEKLLEIKLLSKKKI